MDLVTVTAHCSDICLLVQCSSEANDNLLTLLNTINGFQIIKAQGDTPAVTETQWAVVNDKGKITRWVFSVAVKLMTTC